MSDDVAAMMVTNPNTLGIFEPEIQEIAAALHERGALLYLDGANMNALLGVAKPGRHGRGYRPTESAQDAFRLRTAAAARARDRSRSKSDLEPFLPMPRLEACRRAAMNSDYERPDSIGRMRSFHNNFGMIVRAYAYILALGGDGLGWRAGWRSSVRITCASGLQPHFPSATARALDA